MVTDCITVPEGGTWNTSPQIDSILHKFWCGQTKEHGNKSALYLKVARGTPAPRSTASCINSGVVKQKNMVTECIIPEGGTCNISPQIDSILHKFWHGGKKKHGNRMQYT